MVEEINIIRFRAEGDQRRRVHTGVQMKGKMAATPFCRDASLKISEVVLNCREEEECTLCRMKRFDLKSKFGSLRDWADREGYVVRSDMSGK